MSQNQLRNRSVAIVGAGMAGLQAAKRLSETKRFDVHVFDKARGVGGRTSLRRVDRAKGEQLSFDHGAQYFTARDPRFRQVVDQWIADGVCAPWNGRLAVIDEVGRPSESRSEGDEGETVRFVGVPGMNAMAKAVAKGLEDAIQVDVGARVAQLEHQADPAAGGPWSLELEDGRRFDGFDTVLVTTPPAQAAPLVSSSKALLEVAESVEMRPCWAVMIALNAPLDVPFDGSFINAGPLSWACRNSTKEGRGATETWVLHASPEWTIEHLELKRDEAAELLCKAFGEAIGAELPKSPVHSGAHRWMYSGALEPGTDVCAYDETAGLGLAGDWLNGSKVQGAWLSGLALAERVIGARA